MWGDELMFQMDLQEDESAKKGDEVEDALATARVNQERPAEEERHAAAVATAPVSRTVSAAADIPARASDDTNRTVPVGLSRSQPVYIPSMEPKSEEPKSQQQQAISFMPGPPPGTKHRYKY